MRGCGVISEVLSEKKFGSYVCYQVDFYKWKCGSCGRGVITIIPNDDRQGHKLLTKKCKVCKAKIVLREVSRQHWQVLTRRL